MSEHKAMEEYVRHLNDDILFGLELGFRRVFWSSRRNLRRSFDGAVPTGTYLAPLRPLPIELKGIAV